MNTRNWQIKVLTLCMAAIALCMTGACGDSFPGEEPVAKRIMPADPCPNDINEVPDNPRLSTREELDLKFDRVQEVIDKYDSLLFSREDIAVLSGGYFPYEERPYSFKVDGYTVFIQIRLVHDDVEQRDLPPEKRIPHCLEGVPVHFLTNQPYPTIGN